MDVLPNPAKPRLQRNRDIKPIVLTRRLIETGAVPEDVWLQVLLPCQGMTLSRTTEAVKGANRVILNFHLATPHYNNPEVGSQLGREILDFAVGTTHLIRTFTKDSQNPEINKTEWALEFTVENFQDTDLDFTVNICEVVKTAWQPTPSNKIIFNLPSTVERTTPNTFADQIELFCQSITERQKVCISVHTHNDRGCAVAAAEMAQLAGADRVEGCLFGNGDRAGSADLVTLALNLYSQGVQPGIHLGSLDEVVAQVEELTQIPVHRRAPYAGRNVFSAYTETQHEAICKGYQSLRQDQSQPRSKHQNQGQGQEPKWKIPYIPIDPSDIGRDDEHIIRVNQHSGASGTIHHVKQTLHIDMPHEISQEFISIVKDHATKRGFEVPPDSIRHLFQKKYMRESFTDLHDLGFKGEVTGDGAEVLEKISMAIEQKLGVDFDFELLEFEMQVVEDTRWVDERPTACLIKGASRRSEAVAWGEYLVQMTELEWTDVLIGVESWA